MKKITIFGWYEDELTAEQFNAVLMMNNVLCIRDDSKQLALGVPSNAKTAQLLRYVEMHEDILAPHVITGVYNNA